MSPSYQYFIHNPGRNALARLLSSVQIIERFFEYQVCPKNVRTFPDLIPWGPKMPYLEENWKEGGREKERMRSVHPLFHLSFSTSPRAFYDQQRLKYDI